MGIVAGRRLAAAGRFSLSTEFLGAGNYARPLTGLHRVRPGEPRARDARRKPRIPIAAGGGLAMRLALTHCMCAMGTKMCLWQKLLDARRIPISLQPNTDAKSSSTTTALDGEKKGD